MRHNRQNVIRQGFQPRRRRPNDRPTTPQQPPPTRGPPIPITSPSPPVPSFHTRTPPYRPPGPVSPSWPPSRPLGPVSPSWTPFRPPGPVSPSWPPPSRASGPQSFRTPPPPSPRDPRYSGPSPRHRHSRSRENEDPPEKHVDLDNPRPHPLFKLDIPMPLDDAHRKDLPKSPPEKTGWGNSLNNRQKSRETHEPIDVDAPIDVDTDPVPIDVDAPPERYPPRRSANPARKHDARPVPAWMIRERHAAAVEKEASVRNALRPGTNGLATPNDSMVGRGTSRRVSSPPVAAEPPRPPEELVRGLAPELQQLFEAAFTAGWNTARSGRPGDVRLPLLTDPPIINRSSQATQPSYVTPVGSAIPSKTGVERTNRNEGPSAEQGAAASVSMSATDGPYSAPTANQAKAGRAAPQLADTHAPIPASAGVHCRPSYNTVDGQAVGEPYSRNNEIHSSSRPVTADYSAAAPSFSLPRDYATASSSDKTVTRDPSTVPNHVPPSFRHQGPTTVPSRSVGKLTGEAAFAARGKKRPLSALESAFSAATTSEPVQSKPIPKRKRPNALPESEKVPSALGRIEVHEGATLSAVKPSNGSRADPSSENVSVANQGAKVTEMGDFAKEDLKHINVGSEDLSFLDKYGLLIVDRDSETKAITWVMCKFCHVFGATGRQRTYLKLYDPPYGFTNFPSHLKKEHKEKWEAYQKADPTGKKIFFAGKDLPAPETVEKRVTELKKARAYEKQQTGLKKARKGAIGSDKGKQQEVFRNAFGETLPANIDRHVTSILKLGLSSGSQDTGDPTEEHSIDPELVAGRHIYIASSSHDTSETITGATGRSTDRYFQQVDVYLLLLSFLKKPFDFGTKVAEIILRGVLCDRAQDGESDHERGFSTRSIRETPLQDQSGHIRTFFVPEKQSLEKAMGTMVFSHLLRSVSLGGIDRSVNLMLEICRNSGVDADCSQSGTVGNALCALGLEGLRRVLENKKVYWGFSLTTRRCNELSEDALEVLVVLRDMRGMLHKVHLVSLRDFDGAGRSVLSILDCVCPDWATRMFGISSGLSGKDEVQKKIERSILASLRAKEQSSCILEHVNHTADADKPIFPWILSGLSQAAFDSLVIANIPRLLNAFTDSEISSMKNERSLISMTALSVMKGREPFREGWQATEGRAPLLQAFAFGLSTLWLHHRFDDEGYYHLNSAPFSRGVFGDSHCKTVGDREVDVSVSPVNAEAERTFWARALLRLKQIPC